MLIQECAADVAAIGLSSTFRSPACSHENPARFERADSAACRSSELLEPRAAAVKLIDAFQRIARALSPRDPSTQDDLVQEMCLAALECPHANTRSFFLSLGAWRARDFSRRWTQGFKIPMQVEKRCDDVLRACC